MAFTRIDGKVHAARLRLLLRENCTVTIVHSKSPHLVNIVQGADIVVAAVGRPAFVRESWLKAGAIVIDVGINHIINEAGDRTIVGDVAFDEAALVAAAITLVPGGVGPMTIACLLRNTFDAAKKRRA